MTAEAGQFVALGDLHLSRLIYSGLPNMVGDGEFALKQFADYCIASEIRDAIFLGDNLDARFSPPDVLHVFFEHVGRMLSAGTSIHVLQGQHCRHMTIPIPLIADGLWTGDAKLNSAHERCMSLGGISVYGLDWTPKTNLREAIERVSPEAEVFCGHQLIRQVLNIGKEEDEDSCWDLDLGWLPDSIKLALMADWHGRPQEGEFGELRWVYTGSATLRSISEPVKKSFVRVFREEDSLAIERIPLKTRPYYYSDIMCADELERWLDGVVDIATQGREEALQNGIPEVVASPLFAVRYNVTIPGGYDKINTRV